MSSLISADNTWVLWGLLVGDAALAIWLEQKYKWASKVTGCVLALLGMMILSNVGIIPTESPVYDSVWSYVVPLAIPLLLFQCNIKKIGKESGKLLIIYLISSVGTVLGALVGFFALNKFVPDLNKVAAMFSGTYVGGSVNFAAMADTFGASGELSSQAVVADNLLMALYFFVLIAMPSINFFRKHYKHPLVDEVEAGNAGTAENYWKAKPISLQNIAFCFAASTIIVAISTAIADFLVDEVEAGNAGTAENYWKAKPISLQNIAFCFAASTIIVAISTAIADFFASLFPAEGATFILNQLLGNKYLIMTTITMICATSFPKVFNNAPGANEIGTFLIYIFFAVIGAPASIKSIITQAPLLLVYALIIVACNMLITLVFGKVFKFSLEEIILASNANIGGPTTAAAMAISKGWNKLIGPVLLIGTLGYVLGNYYGVLVGNLLR